MFQNDLILQAARGERTKRTPVWLMRQAGRILPEYREVRKTAGDFISLVKNPELACEVTIQPVDILGVDAAIMFSDILVIPEAMGLPYEMVEAKGPWFNKTIRTEVDLQEVRIANPEEDLDYVLAAIRLIKKELNGRVPLIGFAGAPWTIFCYMTEGRGSKDFSAARKILMTNPSMAHALLGRITDSTIAYLNAQAHNGADMLQLFDSWAGILTADLYRQFALPYIRKICSEVRSVPLTVFAKGARGVSRDLGDLDCRTIGLDWQMDPRESRELIGPEKTLQGNLDPAVLYADRSTIRKETERMLRSFGSEKHIANLGHGVYPDTPADNVKFFIDIIKEYKHPIP
jgi:uroporphyrinogen decarboxylase